MQNKVIIICVYKGFIEMNAQNNVFTFLFLSFVENKKNKLFFAAATK